MTRRLMNKKAFTLIELIVVIAILGVLVLLAAPKLLGYTNDAKLAQIKNDVKVIENALAIEMIDDPEYMVNKGWGLVSLETINGYVEEGSLFDTKGNVDGELLGGEFYVIEDELAKTKLSGKFIASKDGKVYYYEDGLNVGGDESENGPEYTEYVLTDNDFEWVISTDIGTYYKGDEQGYFKYTGTGQEIVEIPHVIDGVPMTYYYRMFYETGEDVKKVISTNENVTNVNQMFRNSQATSLDLSKFNTSNVTDMDGMFLNSQANTLDLSNFDTSSVTSMINMFNGSQANTITFSDKFNTSNVTEMFGMFRDSQATTLDLSNFNTSNVTNMGYMFEGSKATTLDLSSFNTSNVTEMFGMFYRNQATTLDLSSFDTSSVNNMDSMLRGSKATILDLSNFDTSNVKYMSNMFRDSQATTLDLSSFNTSKVTDMSWMFQGSKATTGYAKTQVDADKFNGSSNKPSKLNFVVK